MAVGWLLLFGLAVGLFAAVHIRVRRISGRENIGWRNILSDIDGLATRLLRRNGPGSLLGVSGTPERKGQRRSRRTPPRRRSTATDAAHARDSNPLQPDKYKQNAAVATRRRRKKLVLDLDETLIHASVNCINPQYDLHIELYIDKQLTEFFIYKRPHVDVFLEAVAQWYDIVVFTASLGEYANPVIDALDRGRGIIQERYFRESCGPDFAKNLHIVHADLRNVVIVDNSPGAYVGHEENAVPIATWYNNQDDEELLDLIPFFGALEAVDDVRSVLRFRTYC